MSNDAIRWSMQLRVPPGGAPAKHVLFVLADAVKGNPLRGFFSVAGLVAATQQDRKTVLKNLALLREWGVIEDTGERVGRTGQVPVYTIDIDRDPVTCVMSKGPRIGTGSGSGTVPDLERLNGPESGTSGAGEGSQISAETVPNFRANGADLGTRNPLNPLEPGYTEGAPRDYVGSFEGHPPATAVVLPTAAGAASRLLRELGYRVTSQDPNLLAAVAEGVTLQQLQEFAEIYPPSHPKCTGATAGYVIAAARSQNAQAANAVQTGDTCHGNSSARGSARPSRSEKVAEAGRALDRLEEERERHGER